MHCCWFLDGLLLCSSWLTVLLLFMCMFEDWFNSVLPSLGHFLKKRDLLIHPSTSPLTKRGNIVLNDYFISPPPLLCFCCFSLCFSCLVFPEYEAVKGNETMGWRDCEGLGLLESIYPEEVTKSLVDQCLSIMNRERSALWTPLLSVIYMAEVTIMLIFLWFYGWCTGLAELVLWRLVICLVCERV